MSAPLPAAIGMAASSMSPAINICTIPFELQVAIISHLEPTDVFHLLLTSRALSTLCRTDDIWRPLCAQIVASASRRINGRLQWEEVLKGTTQDGKAEETATSGGVFGNKARLEGSAVEAGTSDEIAVTNGVKALSAPQLRLESFAGMESWWQLASSFLLPCRKFFGFWASEIPYFGRLLKVRVDTLRGLIVAEEIRATNGYKYRAPESMPHAVPPEVPFGALFNVVTRNSYYVPSAGFGPDRGYEVDLFDPLYERRAIFTIDPMRGVASSTSDLLRIELNHRHSRRLDLSGQLTAHVLPMNPTFAPNNTIFPSQSLILAGALREPPHPLPGEPNAFLVEAFSVEAARSPLVEAGSSLSYNATGRGRGAGDPRYLFQEPEPTPVMDEQSQAGYLNLEHDGEHLRINFSTGSSARRRADFFPIKYPTYRSISHHSDPNVESNDEQTSPSHATSLPSDFEISMVEVSSLEGIWCGTYGPHGVEFGYISVRRVPAVVHRADEVDLEEVGLGYIADGRSTSIDLGLIADEQLEGDVLRRAGGGPGSRMRMRRIMEYVKLTGDTNVPRGETSWIAFLPDEVREQGHEGRSASLKGDLGKAATVTSAELLQWAQESLPSDDAKWNQGCLPARARIAGTGFVEPQWIHAEATLIRSTDAAGNGVVDEVRIRWNDLGRHSSFRRLVEVPA